MSAAGGDTKPNPNKFEFNSSFSFGFGTGNGNYLKFEFGEVNHAKLFWYYFVFWIYFPYKQREKVIYSDFVALFRFHIVSVTLRLDHCRQLPSTSLCPLLSRRHHTGDRPSIYSTLSSKSSSSHSNVPCTFWIFVYCKSNFHHFDFRLFNYSIHMNLITILCYQFRFWKVVNIFSQFNFMAEPQRGFYFNIWKLVFSFYKKLFLSTLYI